MKKIIFLSFLFFVTIVVYAQSSGRKTYCNPIDINYQYQYIHENEHLSYRSGADIVIMPFKGEYYLFATNSNGWWQSDDLTHWNYVHPQLWPKEHVNAPAIVVVHDTLFLYQSGRAPLYYSTNPSKGELKVYNPMMPEVPNKQGPVDPDIFYDKVSNNWYMYYGSSNFYPLFGILLNHSEKLAYKGKPVPLLRLYPKEHGWERFGRNHMDTLINPFIEGAWMTKYHGKYYLQYAAPGTEYNVYANGTYIGKSPFGPFHYAKNNPISYKPGGFVTGAGHGNTFQDKYGNFWNTGTCWVGLNYHFERRVDMFPAGFDKDGLMFSNTRFGDFPHYIPTRKWENRYSLFTGWMLLSYEKPVTASSFVKNFVPSHVADENFRTFWLAKTNKKGEWLMMDLQHEDTVKAIQVNYADHNSNIYHSDSGVYSQFRLYVSRNGKNWTKVSDLSNEKIDRVDAYIPLKKPAVGRYVKFVNIHVGSTNLAICALRVFGNKPGKLPETPKFFTVRRHADQRDATISWKSVPTAVGYNILWGIAKNKLYETYQVFNDNRNRLDIRSLDVRQGYYFSIEAFNDVGVSKISKIVYVK